MDVVQRSLANARERYAAASGKRPDRKPADGFNIPYYDGGSSSLSALSAFGTSMQALEQYRHNNGWPGSCISLIAKSFAKQDIMLARKQLAANRAGASSFRLKKMLPATLKKSAKNLQLVSDHVFLQTVERPNPFMVGWALKYVTAASLLITGKGYWWSFGNKETGKPEIWPIPTHWMSPAPVNDGKSFSTWIMRPYGLGGEQYIPASEIAYFALPDPANPIGALSPMQQISKSIVVDEFIRESQKRSFLNGAWPGLAIKIGQVPGSEEFGGISSQEGQAALTWNQRKDIIAMVKALYRGIYKTDEPIILDKFITDITRMTFNPREMDYLKSKLQAKEEITQGFGVNPIMMGQIEGVNRASAAVAMDNFAANTLNPFLELFGQLLTAFVLPRFDASEDLVAFVEEAVSNDPDLQLQRYNYAYTNGIITKDEYRTDVLNLPPMADGAGRVYLLPAMAQEIPGDVAGPDDDVNGPLPEKPEPEPEPAGQLPDMSGGGFAAYYDCLRKHIDNAALLRVWDKQQKSAENRLRTVLTGFMKQYAKRVAGRVRSAIDSSGLSVSTVSDAVGSPKQFAKDFRDAMKPAFRSLIASAAQQEWELVRPRRRAEIVVYGTKDKPLDEARRLKLPKKVLDAIEKQADDILDQPWLKDLPDAVRDRIIRMVEDGIDKGDSGSDVSGKIEEMLGGDAETRAERIARTETTGMMNAGSQEVRSYLGEQGLVSGKEWSALDDEHTRDTHVDADGQVVPVDDEFTVGGEKCQYPGDVSLSAEERCNCRCTALTVFEDAELNEALNETAALFVVKCWRGQIE